MSESARGRGRRRGSPDTKTAILEAARGLFAANGFSATSLRAVAGVAGVDPALVHHYFGSKDDLFVASLALPVDPRTVFAQVADGPRDEVGHRLVRGFLSIWDDPALQPQMMGFARGLMDPSASALIQDGFLAVVISPLGEVLGVDRPDVRLPLVASQIVGIVLLRYLVGVEPLASMSADDVIAIYGPTLQRYLTGELPGPHYSSHDE